MATLPWPSHSHHHLHGIHSRLPFLYPQMQMLARLVTLSVHAAKPCRDSFTLLQRKFVRGAAHCWNSWSKWHVSAWTRRSVSRVHWMLSGMGRESTVWDDSDCHNMKWQVAVTTWSDVTVTTWSDKWLLQHGLMSLSQHGVTSGCYNMVWRHCHNMEWQVDGTTWTDVTVTTWADNDYMLHTTWTDCDYMNNVVVEAHCYALQCRQIHCEQIRSRINQQLIAGRFGHERLRQLCTFSNQFAYSDYMLCDGSAIKA